MISSSVLTFLLAFSFSVVVDYDAVVVDYVVIVVDVKFVVVRVVVVAAVAVVVICGVCLVVVFVVEGAVALFDARDMLESGNTQWVLTATVTGKFFPATLGRIRAVRICVVALIVVVVDVIAFASVVVRYYSRFCSHHFCSLAGSTPATSVFYLMFK